MTISKNLWKLAALLLVMCLISAALISGTLAKYSDTYAGEDTALVAKWKVTGTGDGFNTSGSALTLDLFQHAYDQNVTTSDGGVYIIAPGVGGEFTVQFDNDSDVAAEVDFDIATTGSAVGVPITYWLDTSVASLSAIQLAGELNTAFTTVPINDNVSTVVHWAWAFNGDDVVDTAFGTSSAAIDRTTYGLTITASAIQKAPTE